MTFKLKAEQGETSIYQRLSLSTYQGIVDFMNQRSYKSRTTAIEDLLNIALIVCEKIDRIKDPEFVAEIKAQMREGGLVDYVARLSPKEFEILWSIVRTELKVRNVDIQMNERLL